MSQNKYDFSRRQLIQGAGAVAGAYAASRMVGGGLLGTAHAQFQDEKSALVVVNLRGGYNSLFCSADSFLNQFFGVTSSNILDLGNGLFVDQPTFGTLPSKALTKMATIGVRHGLTSHEAAQDAVMHVNNMPAPLVLASAMGGEGSIKAAYFGGGLEGDYSPVNGVSLQRITDMSSTLAALGSFTNPTIPDREIAAKAMVGSQLMSHRELAQNPKSLKTVVEGYPTAIDTLNKPVKVFDFAEAAQAYGLSTNTTSVGNFRTQMLAAEVMVNAGTNVVIAQDGGWDTHGDTNGANVRQQMSNDILPGLRTFLNRMLDQPGWNVVVAILGEFARSLPGSDHQPNLSVTVIGKKVKVGTTGRTDNDVRLPVGTPGIAGLWEYLAEVTRAQGAPFGTNPHNLVL